MRGRKKKEDALNEVISTRITEEQKQLINKNKWMKKEIDKQIRTYLNAYL